MKDKEDIYLPRHVRLLNKLCELLFALVADHGLFRLASLQSGLGGHDLASHKRC